MQGWGKLRTTSHQDALNCCILLLCCCVLQTCAGYQYKRRETFSASFGYIDFKLNYTLTEDQFQKEFMNSAPCPPFWKLNLLCDPTFDGKIGCLERTVILIKCIQATSIAIENICNVLNDCASCLKCQTFKVYKSELAHECKNIKYVPLTPNVEMISGGYQMTTSNASGFGANGNSGTDINGPKGEVVIIIVVIIIIGFICVPFLVYMVLKR